MIDRDEPRFAEASREMRQRNDYVVPYFNGKYRFDKPPLTYWTQVASYAAFGENDFAARFPSVIATALTSICLFGWGSRLGGTRLAWWSALIFALCLQTFVHARAAVADMWLVLFMTIAFWSGWELFSGSKRRTSNAEHRTPNLEGAMSHPIWWWSFYVALAFAFLAKGPIGWIPLATLALQNICHRGTTTAHDYIRGSIITFAGIILMLAIVAAWAIPALVRTNGLFWTVGIGQHVVGRSIGAMEGHGGSSLLIYLALLPFYLVTVFVSFFPWSIKLPWLIRRLRRQRDALDVYLLCGVGVVFAIFTLVATKLPHYTLPAFPLLALLLARHIIETRFAFAKIAIATTTILLVFAAVMPPLVASKFPAHAVFQKSRDLMQPSMPFGAVDYQEPSLVWYFRARTNGFLTPFRKNKIADFMSEPGPRFAIVPTSLATSVFGDQLNQWKTVSIRGFNIAKGQNVDLTLVLKPE